MNTLTDKACIAYRRAGQVIGSGLGPLLVVLCWKQGKIWLQSEATKRAPTLTLTQFVHYIKRLSSSVPSKQVWSLTVPPAPPLPLSHCRPPLLAAFFVRPFYKLLLGKKVTLTDVEACDPEFYNSTRYILDNDPEPLCLTFSITRECLGQVSERI